MKLITISVNFNTFIKPIRKKKMKKKDKLYKVKNLKMLI